MKKLNQYHSNRGGALLSVVIVMTIVSILGVLIMSVAYTNLNMKVVDKKATDNFYSAEAVMEEIMAGLQEEVSDQYKAAYTSVMERYGEEFKNEADMKEGFASYFVLNLVDRLRAPESQSKYSVAMLKSYLSDGNQAYLKDEDNDNNVLQTLSDGLSLKNVTVRYEKDGYSNKITTDIKILIPDVEFGLISDMPEIAEYAIIAQQGVDVTGYGKISGKAFFGKDLRGIENSYEDAVSILVNETSGLSANDSASSLLVSEGEISIADGSTFETGSITSLWTDMITVNGDNSTVKVIGRTYVKDDTTMNGKNGTLTIGGQYYGYSNNDMNARESSAIIVNGQGTTLNMSDAATLVVAGTSFVSVQGEYSDLVQEDVLMGDSVAVKSNQLAYLVPKECKGIVSNPMTFEQFGALEDGWQDAVLDSYINSLGRTARSYGAVDVCTVFTNRTGGAVYLYFLFDNADTASDYFMAYYTKNEKMKDYLEQYLKVFSIADTTELTRIVTQGNYLVEAESGDGATYHGNTGNIALAGQEMLNYQNNFQSLCKKLVTNTTGNAGIEDTTVYENIINETAIEKLFAGGTASENVTLSGNVARITLPSVEAAGDSIEVIVIDNNDAGDTAYTISEYGTGIVIATGDLILDGTNNMAWNGLVICGGHLSFNKEGLSGQTADNPRILKADADVVTKAMQLSCTIGSEEIFVKNFFVGGENYGSGTSGEGNDGSSDIRNCLVYENWKSE
ncbi:MAG: hypothetical protein E7253_03685 [Lachnospiraceae bacterium]|nr:hypothetical protein [Lachnospiraceae bacterium]